MTPFEKTFIAIDLETTGLEPSKGQIIEVAAVKFRKGKEVDKYSTLINPGRKIPFIVSDITGITDADVEDAPMFSDIKKELSDFIGENPIVGHNVSFDLAFLKANGLEFASSVFDTWKLATIAFTGFASYSLENIAPRLGLDPGSSHRAYDDARLSGYLFLRIGEEVLNLYSKDVLGEVVQFLRRREWEAEEVFSELFEKANEHISEREHKEKNIAVPANVSSAKKLFASKELSLQIEGYEKNSTQMDLAENIATYLEKKKNALFEVEPDSGRILAALAGTFLFSSKTGLKTILATTNTTLRSETFVKDLGLLEKYFPNSGVAIAKSQDSYLCREQFETFMRRQDVNEIEIGLIVKIILWLSITKTGDMEELSLLREQRPVARELSFEGCAYHHKNCFAYQARKELEAADIIVTDQATLVKTLSRHKDFKDVAAIIIDEAEELEESATKALTQTFTQSSVLEFLDTLTRKAPGIGFLERVTNNLGDNLKPEIETIRDSVAAVTESAILLFGVLGIGVKKWGKADEEIQFTVELPIEPAFFEEREGKHIQSVCETFITKCETLENELAGLDDVLHKQKQDLFYHEIAALRSKLKSISSGISEMLLRQEKKWVNWAVLKPDKDFLVKKAPLSVATFLQSTIFQGKTSLLLARNVTFENEASYIEERIGCQGFELKRFGQGDVSKFISLVQVTDMPAPTSPKFLAASHETILESLLASHAPALIVVPSYTASKTYYENLKPELDAAGFSVFAQGVSGGKHKILEKAEKADRPVLIATPTFLHGVKKLSIKARIVFVLRFPFAPSFDALSKAREYEYQSNAFMRFSLPRGLHLFRNIFFYLMSNGSKEKNTLVLFDSRISTARYGDAIMNSLPTHQGEKVTRSEVARVLSQWLS